MPEHARMMGRTKPLSHCSVSGHGDRCEVAREVQAREMGRAEEKRAWRRKVDIEETEEA